MPTVVIVVVVVVEEVVVVEVVAVVVVVVAVAVAVAVVVVVVAAAAAAAVAVAGRRQGPRGKRRLEADSARQTSPPGGESGGGLGWPRRAHRRGQGYFREMRSGLGPRRASG